MYEATWDVHWWQHMSNRDLHSINMFNFYTIILEELGGDWKLNIIGPSNLQGEISIILINSGKLWKK